MEPYLIKNRADINYPIKDGGLTPLMLAAGEGNSNHVQLLIQHGADIQTKNLEGLTVLEYAKSKGYPDIVDFIIKCDKEEKEKKKHPYHILIIISMQKILMLQQPSIKQLFYMIIFLYKCIMVLVYINLNQEQI